MIKITSCEIEDATEHREYTKGDLMPIWGWPGGIDPYPESQLDDIVMMVRYHPKYLAKGSLISDHEPVIGEIVPFLHDTISMNFLISKWNGVKRDGVYFCDFEGQSFSEIKVQATSD